VDLADAIERDGATIGTDHSLNIITAGAATMEKEIYASKSRIEEFDFIHCILLDLRANYPDHNRDALQCIIDIVKYRIDQELQQIESK